MLYETRQKSTEMRYTSPECFEMRFNFHGVLLSSSLLEDSTESFGNEIDDNLNWF